MPGNLNLCFTKVRSPPSSASTADLRRDHSHQSGLTKNFNSLFDHSFDCATTHSAAASAPEIDDGDDGDRLSSSDYDSDHGGAPDLATAFASQRFFFSSPGRSNSIIDSSSLSLSSLASTSSTFPGENLPEPSGNSSNIINGSIMVPTYSPDPYMDFRRSMQEMVDAHDLTAAADGGAGASWDYLHELLACYLSLNPKSTHKYIVGAFADLLVSLVTAPPPPAEVNGRRKSK